MKKIGDITNTADKNGEFTDGNVAAGTPPTQLMAAWFNSVQREILNVLAKAGIPQSATKEDQLAEAITKIVASAGYLPDGYSYSKKDSDEKYATNEALKNTTSQTIFARSEAIPQNADLNDYTNAGLFYQASSNPGANAKNYPPNSSAGSLEVVRTGTTSVKQVYTDWYDKKTYTRRYNGGNKTWAEKWDEDYTKLNPPTPAELNVYSIPQADNKFQPKGNYQPKGDYVDKKVTGEQVIKGSMAVNSAFYVTSDGAGSDLLGLVTWGGSFGFRKRINGTYGGTVEVPYQGGTIALVEQTIGINQTWKNLTSSRSAGVSYTNTSNKPILVALTGQGEGDNSAKITVDNVTVAILGGIKIYSINRGVSFIVPPGSKYLVESTAVIAVWSELS